ncbi:hypothetical protein ACFV9X_13210 [Streptomyces anulatus]|uniref:hypothetical protein n=1 Tax=Streptomyces TaxID=1883 RepID=UPI001161224D|nr:hypothetical protein [Streptomyces sp. TSRI0261]
MSTSALSAAPIPLHIAGEPAAPPAPDVLGTSTGTERPPAPTARLVPHQATFALWETNRVLA